MSDPAHVPVWFLVGQGLATAIIGVVATYVAAQQWRTNKQSLKERLFDRRLAVFDGLNSFLQTTISKAEFTDQEFRVFVEFQQRARFLFDDAIYQYIQEIRHHSAQLKKYQNIRRASMKEANDRNAIEGETKELTWLCDQIDRIYEEFRPYIGFNQVK